MKEDAKMQMAYLRYSVIAPLLAAGDNATLKQRMQEQADRLWSLPNGQTRQFAWGTIEKWLYQYRKGGLGSLVDHPRKDAGSFPGIPAKVADAIDEILNDHPQLKTHLIIRQLKKRKLIVDNKPSLTTIYRYMKTVTRPRNEEQNDTYAFEAPYPN